MPSTIEVLRNLVPAEHIRFSDELKYPDDDKNGNRGNPLLRIKCPLIQFGNDQHDLSTSVWGLNQPHPDAKDQTAHELVLLVSPEKEEKIREVDAFFQARELRSLFKKEKTFEFVPLLKDTDEGIALKVKVKIDGTEVIKTLDAEGMMVSGSKESLNRGCQCLVVGTFKTMWFNEQTGKCGAKLTATRILVQPGTGVDEADMFVLA
tara:strand:+ start:132 stop:749 length:618 start_codon:yes stop_codon:yes gene_type:complete